MKIFIINGPNLNLLGKRQPEIYGDKSFENYLSMLRDEFEDCTIQYFQSNHEGELIDAIQNAADSYDVILLNAGGYTHTSVSLADAVAAGHVPVIEIHISSILAREEFRHISLIAPVCAGTVMGFGLDSYKVGIFAALSAVNKK